MTGNKQHCLASLLLCWSLLVLALRSAHAGISFDVNVTTGRDVALALGNPQVDRLIVVVPTLTVSDRDFDGIAGLPFRVSRNVTITGVSADPLNWPRLAFGGTDKVQLGNNVWLTFSRVIIRPAEWDEAAFRSPRFRLLVATPPGPKAMLLLKDACMNLPYGFDPSIAEAYVLSWIRSPETPGTQQTKFIAKQDRVPPFTEWVGVMYDIDVAADTTISNPATGSVQSLNYITWMVDTWLVFDTQISLECMAANNGDPVPCYLSDVKGINPYGTITTTTITNGTVGGSGPTGSGGHGADGSAQSPSGEGSGGPSTGQIVGAVVGGVIGGLVVLAAAAYAWVAWRRRRAYRGGSTSGSSSSSSGLPEQEKNVTPGAAGGATQGAWPRRGSCGGLCSCLSGSVTSADVEAGPHSGEAAVAGDGPAAASEGWAAGVDGAGSRKVAGDVTARTVAPPAGAVSLGKGSNGAAVVAASVAAGADGSSRQLSQGAVTAHTTTTAYSSSGAGGDFSPALQWAALGRPGGPSSDLGPGSGVGGSDAGPGSSWTPQPHGGGGGNANNAHVDLLSTGGHSRGDPRLPALAAAESGVGGGNSAALSGSVGLGGSKGLGLSEEVVGYRTPLRPGLELNVEVDDGLDGALLATDNTGLDRVLSIAGGAGGGGTGGDAAGLGHEQGAAGAAGGLAAGGASRRRLPSGPDVVEVLPVVLGKGSYGRVFEGRYRGMRVAVKQMLTASGPFGVMAHAAAEAEAGRGSDKDKEILDTFAQEADVLGRCDHPNIARLYAACLTRPRLALVMELADTSLDKLLFREYVGTLMPLGKVLHIATQIAQGLCYLHPTIVHRDLKPANVLINNPSSDTPVVKLTDFGLARIYESTMSTASPEAGTAAYLAPECFDLDNNVVTHRADIYSFGVVVWTMLSGQEPWKETRGIVEIAVKLTMRNERLPLSEALGAERCPPKLERLLMSCWDADPKRRPAAADVAKELVLVSEQLMQPERSTTRSNFTSM